jgi:ribose transport system ATP-binding protein
VAQSQTALDVRGISKRYGETQALKDVDITFEPGTVHTVFGENGSGKSTLIKVLSGIVIPDEGSVRIGESLVRNYSPGAMKRLGIIPVMQEVLVAPNRTVLDNIFLGYDGLLRRRIAYSQRATIAEATLARITNTYIDLNEIVENIPLPQQQLVVIARALVNNPTVLILDEATAALDVGDRETLFDAIRKLTSEGKIVIYISHRMDEVLQLSNSVTVLRNGRKVATVPRAEVTAAKLLGLVQPATSISKEAVDV